MLIRRLIDCSGGWHDDKASGNGVLEYSNGDVYDGQWELDQRHGSITTSRPNLIGSDLIPNPNPNPGWGKFTSSETGSTFEGYWKDGLKEGQGCMLLSNGDSFSGLWKQGAVDGLVQYKFSEKSPWIDPEY